MMRLTRKLYSEPDDEDENDEKTWKRRRNIGIVGTGAGSLIALRSHAGLKGKSDAAKNMIKNVDGGKNFKKLKGSGLILAGTGALLTAGSEIKRRKLKKKNDENKA